MTPPLRGRTVLLTGGGRGLGRYFADVLADAGARLVLTGRDPESLEKAAFELSTRGAQVLALPGDVTVPETMPRVVKRAAGHFGTVDVLVNNAGAAGPIGPTWEVDEDDWLHTMRVNFEGSWRACRAVLPLMRAQRSGRVINIVSAAGRDRWPHCSAYSVSKAASIKLIENLGPELRSHGVAVFSFHPGLLDIGLTGDHLRRPHSGDPQEDRVKDWLHKQHDAGAFSRNEDAGRMLLRLADGTADALSGGYVTVETALPARRERT
ncbi:SDR family NAD(P)-dependent oxidoreductase [Streptomyces sp. NPDC050121]|uniref:SDR family NAD(P)-dependent oxidoreductase n=1 Tax=Streptomyces sp. NPDC050121 TaxID=3365601 RepID=UPI00379C4A83